jgi:hypothetical protein
MRLSVNASNFNWVTHVLATRYVFATTTDHGGRRLVCQFSLTSKSRLSLNLKLKITYSTTTCSKQYSLEIMKKTAQQQAHIIMTLCRMAVESLLQVDSLS